jgi:hypothetical protein
VGNLVHLRYCSRSYWQWWLFWLWIEICVAIVLTIGGFVLGGALLEEIVEVGLKAGFHT